VDPAETGIRAGTSRSSTPSALLMGQNLLESLGSGPKALPKPKSSPAGSRLTPLRQGNGKAGATIRQTKGNTRKWTQIRTYMEAKNVVLVGEQLKKQVNKLIMKVIKIGKI